MSCKRDLPRGEKKKTKLQKFVMQKKVLRDPQQYSEIVLKTLIMKMIQESEMIDGSIDRSI